jgi:hypothetical protein
MRKSVKVGSVIKLGRKYHKFTALYQLLLSFCQFNVTNLTVKCQFILILQWHGYENVNYTNFLLKSVKTQDTISYYSSRLRFRQGHFAHVNEP